MASIGSTNYNFFTGVSFGSVSELQEIVDTEGWEAMYDIVAEMSHPLLGQSCDRGEEIIGRSPLQERYADMQSGRGVIRATV
ncbi:hypothetical protein OUZ56_001708 [Daphnia magna]|uniref:Uncharacterized protein n=1 Tax=Daphnia magna TaxID=35525 RepID=A0ABR0A3H1_9CRUS|nr:hypothetical protein OUZ56_001708 [Daphnia magna]